MSATKKLNDALREVFSRQSATMNTAATLMGVPSGSLKTWITENKFPAEALEKFVELRWLTKDQIEKSTFDRARPRKKPALLNISAMAPTLKEVFNQVDSFGARMEAQEEEFKEISRQLFSALRKDDEFIFVSLNEVPFEWEPDGWGKVKREICKAVKDGASLIYALPSNDDLLQAKKRLPGAKITEGEFDELFHEFLQRLIHECSGETTEAEIRQRVLFKATRIGFFHTPRTKLAFFRQHETQETRAFVAYRRGTNWLSLPYDADLCGTLMRWLLKEGCIEA